MPLTSDAPEVTQETKREDSESDRRKLRTIELRPTEVEGREENEVIVEDAGVVRAANAMGSPKVDAVAGDAGSKGTPPDKVASSSSSSCKGGMDSGGMRSLMGDFESALPEFEFVYAQTPEAGGVWIVDPPRAGLNNYTSDVFNRNPILAKLSLGSKFDFQILP